MMNPGLSRRLARVKTTKAITAKGDDWWWALVKSAEENKRWTDLPKKYQTVVLLAEKETK